MPGKDSAVKTNGRKKIADRDTAPVQAEEFNNELS